MAGLFSPGIALGQDDDEMDENIRGSALFNTGLAEALFWNFRMKTYQDGSNTRPENYMYEPCLTRSVVSLICFSSFPANANT